MPGVRLAAAFTPVRVAVKAVPASGMKTVQYQGYQISVPGNWPVYFLNKDSDRCIRYDVNAVYLGTPGTDQKCPAGLVGRADTISIGAPAPPTGQGPLRGASRSATSIGTIFQDAGQQEVAVDMPAAAPAITATYGTDPGQVEQMLASVRAVPQPASGPARPPAPDPFLPPATPPAERAAPPAERAAPPAERQAPAVSPHTPPAAQNTPAPQPQGTPQSSPSPSAPPGSPSPSPSATTLTASASPSPARQPNPVAGFDTCTAPSLHTMKAWRARFSVTSIYIGGQMMACDYGNLTAGWIRQAKAMGWSLLPTYVGLQAPCNGFSGKINPKHAAAQGTSAANQAIADANSFGLGKGTPIYYDIEAYNNTKAKCVTAVLTFLDAWTRQLRAQGYVSGVYSSAGSGIIDLQNTTRIAGHSLAEPQAIWFALWDNATNLTGRPYMTSAVWPMSARSKQYCGPHLVKVGGIGLDIDSDLVNGPVARG